MILLHPCEFPILLTWCTPIAKKCLSSVHLLTIYRVTWFIANLRTVWARRKTWRCSRKQESLDGILSISKIIGTYFFLIDHDWKCQNGLKAVVISSRIEKPYCNSHFGITTIIGTWVSLPSLPNGDQKGYRKSNFGQPKRKPSAPRNSRGSC